MVKGSKGWFFESRRHALASKGIKTGRKVEIDRWTSPSPSLLSSDLKKYSQIGADLVKAGLISGFQIRDIKDKNLNKHKLVMYAHSNRQHLNSLMAQIKDLKGVKLIKEFPRVSGYAWDKDWKLTSARTKLYEIDTSKKASLKIDSQTKKKMVGDASKRYYAIDFGEAYIIISAENPDAIIDWMKQNTIEGYSKKPIKDSWTMPDIRTKNIDKLPSFSKAYQIRKPIDSDTEFVTLVANKKTSKKVMGKMKGKERVEDVLVQDIPGHSLYQLVKGS